LYKFLLNFFVLKNGGKTAANFKFQILNEEFWQFWQKWSK